MNLIYKYRILKSSWGIAIDLEAKAVIYTQHLDFDINQETVRLNDTITLSISPECKLEADEVRYLGKAILNFSTEVESKLPEDSKVNIHVVNIIVNYADYQPEGLYCAMVGWLTLRFDFPMPQLDVRFDKGLNRYIIDTN